VVTEASCVRLIAERSSVCTLENYMDPNRFNSAYCLGLRIVLIYVVLTMLVPRALEFANLVVSNARRSQTVNAQSHKLSSADLEAALRGAKQFGPNSQLDCNHEPAAPDWDYVCSYMPTPLQSPTRLQFGVNVDATRWVKVSRVMPMGTILPRPQ
jgi:hypothetical protein